MKVDYLMNNNKKKIARVFCKETFSEDEKEPNMKI